MDVTRRAGALRAGAQGMVAASLFFMLIWWWVSAWLFAAGAVLYSVAWVMELTQRTADAPVSAAG